MSKNARGSKSAKTREALVKLTGDSSLENKIGSLSGKAKSTGDGKVKSTGDGKVKNAGGAKTKSTGGSKVKKSEESKKSKSDSIEKLPEEIKLERQSNKTPMVLKLLEQDKSSSNPVILAGKSRIPRQLSGREPLSRILKREMGADFSDIDGTVVVNITQMAIEFLAPDILDRFNACSCDRCVEEFSRIIAERVPVRFARISKGAQYRGSHELNERMEPARKMVLSEMIKELIGNKKRCFHDE